MSKENKIKPEAVEAVTIELPIEVLQYASPELLGLYASYSALTELGKHPEEIVEIQDALYGHLTSELLRMRLVDAGLAQYEGDNEEEVS